VRAIEALLLSPAEDAAELARAVIEKLDSLRGERETYAIVSATPYGVTWGYGGYPTPHQAVKAMGKGVGHVDGGRVGVIKIHPALSGLPDEPDRTCPDCKHPREAHNFPRSRVPGCVVGLPVNGSTKSPHPRCECKSDGKS
jgi:hypothetical protein